MGWSLKVIEVREFGRYAALPMTIRVETVLTPLPLLDQMCGLSLKPEPVPVPYEKDYDLHGGPASWPDRFDVSAWNVVVAVDGDLLLGGAAAFGPALGYAGAVAELWDIRVLPDVQRSGVGRALLQHQQTWARQRGFGWLKAETQNVNVGACHFYKHEGGLLGAINRFAYAGQTDIEHEIELDWFFRLASK